MGNRSLVLICEDSREDTFLLRHAFVKAGLSHRLVDVRNGQQAINYLSGIGLYTDRQQHPLPNLVLIDLKMPLLDGFEVLAWIQTRTELQSTPVVVVSGSSEPTDIEAAKKLGAKDYLVKPKDLEELVKFARLLHDRYLANPIATAAPKPDTTFKTRIDHPRPWGSSSALSDF